MAVLILKLLQVCCGYQDSPFQYLAVQTFCDHPSQESGWSLELFHQHPTVYCEYFYLIWMVTKLKVELMLNLKVELVLNLKVELVLNLMRIQDYLNSWTFLLFRSRSDIDLLYMALRTYSTTRCHCKPMTYLLDGILHRMTLSVTLSATLTPRWKWRSS